jgi:hypothetical protein
MAGKQLAAGVLGSVVFPEMRLTVSFRITYTLRPVWGAEVASQDCLVFRSRANLAIVVIQEYFAGPLRLLKHQGGIERGLLP